MRVVIWSGGLDSTLLLVNELAHHPGSVRALTLVGHHQLSREQQKAEAKARREFKAWAKEKGWTFRHNEVRVTTKADATQQVGQSGLWLAHLAPYVDPGDIMLFGYIRGDDFWHGRHLFVDAFGAMKRSHYAGQALIQFPLEWYRKQDVLAGAKRYRIPSRCWWTCETNRPRKRACGRCVKCRGQRRAIEDLRDLGESYGLDKIAPPVRETLIDDSDRDDEKEDLAMVVGAVG